MAIKAILIDDEPKLREVLHIKLMQNCKIVDVVAKVSNAKEGYDAIRFHKPDLVFLDIAMPGETGFDMLNRFENINFEIIFVTGFDEYGLDALKVSAVDYLLKPVRTEDLIEAVSKAVLRIESKEKVLRYDLLKHNINTTSNDHTRVAIPGSSAYEFVAIDSLIRCEGWQKYTRIILTSGEVIVSSYNLGVFKDMLSSFNFISTHKSHLINKNHIRRYLKEGEVVMSNGDKVPVARRRKDDFMDVLFNGE